MKNLEIVKNILNKEKILFSKELKQKIKFFRSDLSDAGIRKIISRINSKEIEKIKLHLKSNERLFIKKDFFKSPEYYKEIFGKINKKRPYYKEVISYLCLMNGFATFSELMKHTSHKNNKELGKTLNDLKKLDIIFQTKINQKSDLYQITNEFARYNENFDIISNLALYRYKVKFIKEFKSSIIRFFNINGFIKLTKNNKIPFEWDLTGESYLGLNINNKPLIYTLTFFPPIIDQNIEDEILFFLERRIHHIKHNKSKNKNYIFPYIAIPEIKNEKNIYSLGIGILNYEKIIGKDIFNNIKYIFHILKEIITQKEIEKEKIQEYSQRILDEISKTTGTLINLKGYTFELLIALYYNFVGYKTEIGKKIRLKIKKGDNTEVIEKEIDIIAEHFEEKIVIECKATKQVLNLNDTKNWLKKISLLYNEYFKEEKNYNNTNIKFQIWSINGYTEESKKLLEEKSKKITKYRIEFFDYQNLIEKIKKFPKLKKIAIDIKNT